MLIVGQTEAGKTTLAKRMSHEYKRAGYGVIVLDPLKSSGWSCDYLFATSDAFFAYVMDKEKCTQCALFIDEAGMAMDKYDTRLQWATTVARHHGHRSHLLSQRAESVNRTTRSQCGTLAAFRLAVPDCKAYARDFAEPALLECHTLEQGEYMLVKRFKASERLRLF